MTFKYNGLCLYEQHKLHIPRYVVQILHKDHLSCSDSSPVNLS